MANATKQFNNENTVAIWKKVSKAGKEYYSGTMYVGNVAYNITMFDNEATSETMPVMKGKIEIRESK